MPPCGQRKGLGRNSPPACGCGKAHRGAIWHARPCGWQRSARVPFVRQPQARQLASACPIALSDGPQPGARAALRMAALGRVQKRGRQRSGFSCPRAWKGGGPGAKPGGATVACGPGLGWGAQGWGQKMAVFACPASRFALRSERFCAAAGAICLPFGCTSLAAGRALGGGWPGAFAPSAGRQGAAGCRRKQAALARPCLTARAVF